MEFLVYRSRALVAPDSRECEEILASSLRNNARTGITGFLHAEPDIFLQYIEGPGKFLWALYDMLLADDRHTDVTLLGTGFIQQRLFPDWRMGYAGPNIVSFLDFLAEATQTGSPEEATASGTIAFLYGASQRVDLGLNRRS